MCSGTWLTDCVSWALVQHMKNFSLLLQLLAWPSSSRCLMEGGKRAKRESIIALYAVVWVILWVVNISIHPSSSANPGSGHGGSCCCCEIYMFNIYNIYIPECIGCEIALTPTSSFQFDKCAARWVKGAHQGNANTEYHKPVASNNSCNNKKKSEDFCETTQSCIPFEVFLFLFLSLTQSQVFGSDIRARLVILDEPGNSHHSVHQLHQQNSWTETKWEEWTWYIQTGETHSKFILETKRNSPGT